MSRLVIFDADSIIYTVAWSYRNKKVKKLVEMSTNKFLSDVLMHTNSTHFVGFYGSKELDAKPNFRYKVDPQYKATRPEAPDFIIQWRSVIHDVFKNQWNFCPVDGMEADDAVLMAVNKYRDQYDEIVVATFDKDLKQIPNITFYDMKTRQSEYINSLEAGRYLAKQLLMGDSTDNIPGLPKVGKVTATNLVAKCQSPFELKMIVARSYYQYEQLLYNEAITAATKSIQDSLKGTTADTIPAQYKNLSGPRLDRVIRINTIKQVKSTMDSILPGGWKGYLSKQYQLVGLLSYKDDFTIPEVQKSPYIDIINNTSSAEYEMEYFAVDEFLTI